MEQIRIWMNRRSVVLTWLLSYLAILFLPVLMSLIVYSESNRMLKEEIHEANIALLNQTREVMDKQFQTMERLNFELTWNVKLRELLDYNKYANYPEDFKYDLHRITQDLKQYKSAYSQIDAFYVYMTAKDIVILPDVYREALFAYQLLLDGDFMAYEKWSALMKQDVGTGFSLMVRKDDAGKSVRTIAYTSTSLAVTGNPIGTNVIMIDQSNILQAVHNVELFNEGHVLILNDRNEVLVANQPIAIPDNFPFDLLSESETLTLDVENRSYEVTSLRSAETGLQYISFIPSRLFWEKAEMVRKLTYVSIGISLVGGMILTYFFISRNYDPVKRLVKIFVNMTQSASTKGMNEFHFLQDAVNKTLTEMDSMMLNMKRQHYIVRSHFVTRLLKGKVDNEIPIEEELAALQMTFDSDKFAVMLLYVEDIDRFLDRYPNVSSIEKMKLLHFIITNVMEDTINRKHRGFVTEIGETLACLVNFLHEDDQQSVQDIVKAAEEAKRFLKEHYRIQLEISISNMHDTVKGIADAYTEALYTMEYKLVMGEEGVITYEELQQEPTANSNRFFYFPETVVQRLINFTKVGDYENAKQILDELIMRNFEKPAVSTAMIKCLLMDLVSDMIRSIEDDGASESFLIQTPELIESLIVSETVKDMQIRMTELLQTICAYAEVRLKQKAQQSSKRAMDERMQSVIAFVNEHLYDSNLNISMIGHHFDLKPAYLSKLFKEYTGEGVLDSINKARLAQAKLLLAEEERTINEVAQSVGYHDVNAFIRVFKKYEGITPGKYRETLNN